MLHWHPFACGPQVYSLLKHVPGVSDCRMEELTADGMFSVDIVLRYKGHKVAVEVDGPVHYMVNRWAGPSWVGSFISQALLLEQLFEAPVACCILAQLSSGCAGTLTLCNTHTSPHPQSHVMI